MLVSGPISYKKIVLDFDDYDSGQPFHKIIHLFGDRHVIRNQCKEKSLKLEELVDKTIREHHEPIDIFCEMPFPKPYELTQNSDYLDSFYDYFHTKYDCFSYPPSEQCKQTLKPHRFHNIDLRITLYWKSYLIVLSQSQMHGIPIKSNTFSEYNEHVNAMKTKLEEFIVSQADLNKATRLYIWTHFLISIRGQFMQEMYNVIATPRPTPATIKAANDQLKNNYDILSDMSNFTFPIDLYYAMTKKTYPMPLLKAKIDIKFPTAPPLLPYYLERYHHTIDAYPSEKLKSSTRLFLEHCLTTLRTEFKKDEFLAFTPETREDESAVKGAVMMDFYSVLRICKPDINHVIYYAGNVHMKNMVTLFESIKDMKLKRSFNFGADYNNWSFETLTVENVEHHTIPAGAQDELLINHYNDKDMIRSFRSDCTQIGVPKEQFSKKDIRGGSFDLKRDSYFLKVENDRTPDFIEIDTYYQCRIRVLNTNPFPVTLKAHFPIFIDRLDNESRQCIYIPEFRFDDNVDLGVEHSVKYNRINELPKYQGTARKRTARKRTARKRTARKRSARKRVVPKNR